MVESSPLPCTRRARTTTPALFSRTSGVSKKTTCRIWAFSGSISSARVAARRWSSATVSFSSTESDLPMSFINSWSWSSVNRARGRADAALTLVASLHLHLDEPIELDGVLHRQFLGEDLEEALDDEVLGLVLGEAPLIR